MTLYIGRSGTGRYAVVDHIPQEYVAGPFMSPDTAFDYLTTLEMSRLRRKAVADTLADLAICAGLIVALVVVVWHLPGGW